MHRVEPRRIDRAVGPAQRREHRHIRVLFEESHQLLVDVADHVREHVDAGAKQRFRVTGIRGVHCDTQLVRVRLVDDGSVKIGGKFLIVPPRSSTHVLISVTFRGASSCTDARAPSGVVTGNAA